jgi:hypothetical protein
VLDGLAPGVDGLPADIARVVRAVAMWSARPALGDDVIVSGTQDGAPWTVAGQPVTAAAARNGEHVVLADDIVSAVVRAISG